MTDVRIAGPLPNVRARSGKRARESRFGNTTKPRILERPFVGNSLLTRMDAKESASLPSPPRNLINKTAPEIAGTTETPWKGSKVLLSSEITRARLTSFTHQWTGAPPSIIKILSRGYSPNSTARNQGVQDLLSVQLQGGCAQSPAIATDRIDDPRSIVQGVVQLGGGGGNIK